jgi:hypothetical protein
MRCTLQFRKAELSVDCSLGLRPRYVLDPLQVRTDKHLLGKPNLQIGVIQLFHASIDSPLWPERRQLRRDA